MRTRGQPVAAARDHGARDAASAQLFELLREVEVVDCACECQRADRRAGGVDEHLPKRGCGVAAAPDLTEKRDGARVQRLTERQPRRRDEEQALGDTRLLDRY